MMKKKKASGNEGHSTRPWLSARADSSREVLLAQGLGHRVAIDVGGAQVPSWSDILRSLRQRDLHACLRRAAHVIR